MRRPIHELPVVFGLALLSALAGCDVGDEIADDEPDDLETIALAPWHREQDVADAGAYAKVLAEFNQGGLRGSFISNKHEGDWEIEIAYRIVRARTPVEKGAIVVVNGYSESFEHHAELAYDLTRQGYTLYMLDNRGQGQSGRMIGYDRVGDDHYQKGTVDHFNDYVDDLHKFITTVVVPDRGGKPRRTLFGLGDSMGGTILTLYAMWHPNVLAKFALISPMHRLDIDSDYLWVKVSDLLGSPNDYADWHEWTAPRPFKGNLLTHSEARHTAMEAVFARKVSVRLGGPTYRWVAAALDATDKVRSRADLIRDPILLLSASEDHVVDNSGQRTVCDRINAARPGLCELRVLQGSLHAPLLEADPIRMRALGLITSFFDE